MQKEVVGDGYNSKREKGGKMERLERPRRDVIMCIIKSC